MRETFFRAMMAIRKPIHRYHYARRSGMQFPTYPDKIRDMIHWSPDPVRYATMALALERIRRESIPGAIAEIGVHRGYTSRFLNAQMPDRMLYLFDTFAGFPDGLDDRFRNTSVDFVKARLDSMENVVFRVGAFPGTAEGFGEQQFSFVLFDADKYDVAMACLGFFYPRLSRGGYFVLHDFNSSESDWAVRKALHKFLSDKPEQIIEVADICGTALFRKI